MCAEKVEVPCAMQSTTEQATPLLPIGYITRTRTSTVNKQTERALWQRHGPMREGYFAVSDTRWRMQSLQTMEDKVSCRQGDVVGDGWFLSCNLAPMQEPAWAASAGGSKWQEAVLFREPFSGQSPAAPGWQRPAGAARSSLVAQPRHNILVTVSAIER